MFTLATLGCTGQLASAEVAKSVLASIHPPHQVEASIGRLNFIDGASLPETAERVYEDLDTARTMDTFMKGQPAASVHGNIQGSHSLGAVQAHEIVLSDKLLNSKSLFLTANTSTLYAFPDLDLKRDGPTVVEGPDGLLEAANDGYFRYLNDLMKAGKISVFSADLRGRGSGWLHDPQT